MIDEIQKVPALLDEVHWLIENRGLHFALCGSSARKVKRGAANLLGGRALRFELHGLTAGELGRDFDLDRMLNHGYLPRIYESSRPNRLLNAYVADYLKEEVAAEGLVRNLPTFSEFLDVASLRDGEIVNFSNIARECGVSSHTTNRLAKRGELSPGSELYGKALENWVFHELSAFAHYREFDGELSYWRLASGIEVDFILGDMQIAIEAKSSARITRDHLKGLRSLKEDHPGVGRRIVVCRESRARKTEDGIEIIPTSSFVRRLWAGDLA